MYQEFSKIYDVLMDIDYHKIVKQIEMIWEKNPPKSILEMGCGTGNIAEKLEKKYHVEAFDLSEEMLNIASKKLKKTTLYQDDFRTFQTNTSFDAILCMLNGLNYLSSRKELYQVFLRVNRALVHGGYFLFDINTAYALSKVLGNKTVVQEDKGIFYAWQNRMVFGEKEVHSHLDFFVPVKNGYRRIQEYQVQHIFYLKEMAEMLRKAGFKILCLKDLESGTLRKVSTRRAFWAVKKIKTL